MALLGESNSGENESGRYSGGTGPRGSGESGGPKRRRSRREISQSISEGQREHARIERQFLRDVAEWDERELWREDGCKNMVQWVSGRFNISHYYARLRIHCSHALDVLPLIDQALSSGELSLDKTIHLTRFATAENERHLVKWARRVQVSTIKLEADRLEGVAKERIREAQRERYLRWWWSDDGHTLYFDGGLPTERGLMFVHTLSQLVKTIPEVPEEDENDEEPDRYTRFERRSADALYALLINEINSQQDAERAHVVVHTELAHVDRMGTTEQGRLLHPVVVEKLECDGRLRYVLTDEKGNALGIGKASQSIPRWLRRQLKYRDERCTFPGCSHNVFVQGHHIERYPAGPTDLWNLVLVCDFHHDLIHKFGWEVRLEGSIATWYRPSGEEYVPGPDPPISQSAG